LFFGGREARTGVVVRRNSALAKRSPKNTAARRLPTQSRSRLSVDLCLRAAQLLLERDGIDGVTTKRIADAAGLSVGAVYGYFPNKEAIICQLGASWLAEIRELIYALHPERSGIADPFSYVDALTDLCVTKYDSNPGLGTVINMLSAIPELRELETRHDRDVCASITAAFAVFLPPADPEDLAALASSLQSMAHAAVTAAVVQKTCDRERTIRNLRLASYALVAHLAAPLRRASGSARPAAARAP